MYEIIKKKQLSDEVFFMSINAPRIARKRKAGQFIILRSHEEGERIPLTIAGSDPEQGTLDIIFQAVGASTGEFAEMSEGDSFSDIVGPLGKPTEIQCYGTAVCVGGGIGTAPILPIAKALKEKGNTLYSIVGARTENLLILTDEMEILSDKFFITTDDGSKGHKGFVTDILRKLIEQENIDIVFAIGPPIMLKFLSGITKEYGIRTVVSLNAIMVDGTGMCGGCRVTVGDEVKFTCVDGPEFDGHSVDYDELMKRLSMYKEYENNSARCRLKKEAEHG